MFEEPPKETAREKAQRIWRNNWIQRNTITILDETSNVDWDKIIEEDKRMNRMRSKLTIEIKRLLTGHNNTILTKYRIAIEARKRRLLREKLRRLEAGEKHE